MICRTARYQPTSGRWWTATLFWLWRYWSDRSRAAHPADEENFSPAARRWRAILTPAQFRLQPGPHGFVGHEHLRSNREWLRSANWRRQDEKRARRGEDR